MNYFCINKTYIKAIMQQITTSSNKERLDGKDFVNKYITYTIHPSGKIKKVRQSGRYENQCDYTNVESRSETFHKM